MLPLDDSFARQFAQGWVDSWNSHDRLNDQNCIELPGKTQVQLDAIETNTTVVTG